VKKIILSIIAALLTLLLPLFGAVYGQTLMPSCNPIVTAVRFDGKADAKASARMAELFQLDQAPRLAGAIDWEQVSKTDAARRHEVLALAQAGQLTSQQDYYYAAFIFQHGNCPEHYLLANTFAKKSIELGGFGAKWIYAATLDRYLDATGKPQKYGTQLSGDPYCNFELANYDTSTSDKERLEYAVPTLAQSLADAKSLSMSCRGNRVNQDKINCGDSFWPQFGTQADPVVSQRLKQLAEAFGNITSNDYAAVQQRWQQQQAAQKEVRELLKRGQIVGREDYYQAALMLTNSFCRSDTVLARGLADRAFILGKAEAGPLYAQAIDRLALFDGLPQRFGTQTRFGQHCEVTPYPTDPKTSDSERQKYGIAPLAMLQRQLKETQKSCLEAV
jgi:hypothetical protein